jgi:hypothetical protein
MTTRLEAIAGWIAVNFVHQRAARLEDGLGCDRNQLATMLCRHFRTAVRHYGLTSSEAELVHQQIGPALERIVQEANKLRKIGDRSGTARMP